MNKKIFLLSVLGCVGLTQAQYIIQYPVTNIVFKKPDLTEKWVMSSPLLGNWQNTGNIYGCLTWSPDASTVTVLESFTQSSNDCKQDQSRSIQNREQEMTSKQYRNVGDSLTETQVITTSLTRTATGIKETWIAGTPSYTTWANIDAVSGCSNWSPETNTVIYGNEFIQTATDCKQNQTRSKQNREQETTTKAYRNIGVAVTENQIITTSSGRNAIGTKENWVTTSPDYTEWTNTGVISGCSNWTPDVSTIDAGKKFDQTATDCKQPQIRTRQNREQETGSKAFRNVGNPVTEDNVITVSSTREATGMKAVPKVCAYGNSTWASVPPNLTIGWKETTTPVAERFSVTIPFNSTSYVKDGYLYTKGRAMFSQGSNLYSEICRQPI
jgi:hypothetical protein